MDLTYSIGDSRSGNGNAPPFPIYGGPHISPIPVSPSQRLSETRQWPRKNNSEDQRPTPDEAMDIDNASRLNDRSIPRLLQSPLADKLNHRVLQSKPSKLSNGSGEGHGTYNKLSKGDAGYGGQPLTPEPGEGLLARKLRGLGVQRDPKAMEKNREQERDGWNSAW